MEFLFLKIIITLALAAKKCKEIFLSPADMREENEIEEDS